MAKKDVYITWKRIQMETYKIRCLYKLKLTDIFGCLSLGSIIQSFKIFVHAHFRLKLIILFHRRRPAIMAYILLAATPCFTLILVACKSQVSIGLVIL